METDHSPPSSFPKQPAVCPGLPLERESFPNKCTMVRGAAAMGVDQVKLPSPPSSAGGLPQRNREEAAISPDSLLSLPCSVLWYILSSRLSKTPGEDCENKS